MSKLLRVLNPAITQYRDRRFEGSETDWENALATSTTIYVGNLAFTTREEQLYDVFGRVGHIKRIVMGLDKLQKTPCGFAFAIYYTRKDAEEAVAFLNGTLVDERAIRVDLDWGFVEGRQYGRGRSGGQVRDEFRQDYDPGRGGYGKLVQAEIMEQMGMGMDGGAGGGRHDPRGDAKRQRVYGGGRGGGGGGTGRGRGGGGGGHGGVHGAPPPTGDEQEAGIDDVAAAAAGNVEEVGAGDDVEDETGVELLQQEQVDGGDDMPYDEALAVRDAEGVGEPGGDVYAGEDEHLLGVEDQAFGGEDG